jgi:hypothetical protein
MRGDNNPSINGRNTNRTSFSKEIEDFDELPALIEEAARLMGLDENKAFARDVLSVEICGPGRPQL